MTRVSTISRDAMDGMARNTLWKNDKTITHGHKYIKHGHKYITHGHTYHLLNFQDLLQDGK